MGQLAQDLASAPRAEGYAVNCCPLCGCGESRLFKRLAVTRGPAAGTYELRQCLACELIFVDPRLDDSILARLYDEDFYFSTGWALRGIAELVMRQIQRTRQRRVERFVRTGALLDIGSGDGRFVQHMAGEGWRATGIDFSPAAQALAEARGGGGRFLCGSIFDHEIEPASIDAVTLWQVFEHIGEPREFLERTHALMRPGGVFVAAVPNIDGLSARLTGERWWGLDVPRHLVHYSPRTLCRGLEEAGFTVERVNHLSLQYDPYGLLHSSLDWVFTRRHFLSDLAKLHLPPDLTRAEFAYNVAALVLLGPVLAPLSLVATATAGCVGQGGFIEVFARRAPGGQSPARSRPAPAPRREPARPVAPTAV
ncbi:MAG TPA: class I SAM-dependent methyltransferase [Candidatus Eisenbacteria bacterium]